MRKIRVFIVEDHELVREGLRFFMSGIPLVEVIGIAETASEALHLIPRCSPDIIIVDLGLPSAEIGLSLIQDIKKRFSRIKILVLTSYESNDIVHRAIISGANGYLLKSASIKELSSAITTISSGEAYITPNILNHVIELYAHHDKKSDDGTKSLTRREREVLSLIADGKRNKDIGDTLFISHRTVEKHKSSLKQKLNCHNSIELATYFLRNNTT